MPKKKLTQSSEGNLRTFLKSAFRTTLSTAFLFLGLFVIMNIYQGLQQPQESCHDETIQLTGGEKLRHLRSWENLRGRNNCMDYESEAAISDRFLDERLHLPRPDYSITTDAGYWGYVYQKLVEKNGHHVDFVADSLLDLARKRELSRFDLAELMVTFVQDIPYTLISSKDCEEDYTGPCRGNEAFGILSPYEFLHSLQGDCDTRSVLLYTMLKKAGFHPLIVVSREYAHAMIALDVPATGDFINYQRQKYYFWETTSHGWSPGMLPPSTNNVQYWKIALAHEF